MNNRNNDKNAVAVHVDDLIYKFDFEKQAEAFEQKLEKVYGKVSKHKVEDGEINFSGRTIKSNINRNIEITMKKITQKFIEGLKGKGARMCPSDADIFQISPNKTDRIKIDQK